MSFLPGAGARRRHIDLSGGRTTQRQQLRTASRAETLARARSQRAARDLLRARTHATQHIQRVWRARHADKTARHAERAHWDKLAVDTIRTFHQQQPRPQPSQQQQRAAAATQKGSAPIHQQPMTTVHHLIRSLVRFFTPKLDYPRLRLASKLLMAAITAAAAPPETPQTPPLPTNQTMPPATPSLQQQRKTDTHTQQHHASNVFYAPALFPTTTNIKSPSQQQQDTTSHTPQNNGNGTHSTVDRDAWILRFAKFGKLLLAAIHDNKSIPNPVALEMVMTLRLLLSPHLWHGTHANQANTQSNTNANATQHTSPNQLRDSFVTHAQLQFIQAWIIDSEEGTARATRNSKNGHKDAAAPRQEEDHDDSSMIDEVPSAAAEIPWGGTRGRKAAACDWAAAGAWATRTETCNLSFFSALRERLLHVAKFNSRKMQVDAGSSSGAAAAAATAAAAGGGRATPPTSISDQKLVALLMGVAVLPLQAMLRRLRGNKDALAQTSVNLDTVHRCAFACFVRDIVSVPLLLQRLTNMKLGVLVKSVIFTDDMWSDIVSTISDARVLCSLEPLTSPAYDTAWDSNSGGAAPRAALCSRICWLFGNVVQQGASRYGSKQGVPVTNGLRGEDNSTFFTFVQAVQQMLVLLPADVVRVAMADASDTGEPSKQSSANMVDDDEQDEELDVHMGTAGVSRVIAHPLLRMQYRNLNDIDFLRRFDLFLKAGSQSSPQLASASTELSSLCSLIDTILRFSPSKTSTFFNKIVWSTSILPRLWNIMQSEMIAASGTNVEAVASNTSAFLRIVDHFAALSLGDLGRITFFFRAYGHALKIVDTEDFFVTKRPFSVEQAREIVVYLKAVVYFIFWGPPSARVGTSSWCEDLENKGGMSRSMHVALWGSASAMRQLTRGTAFHGEDAAGWLSEVGAALRHLLSHAVMCFRQLRDVQARRQFSEPDLWLMPQLPMASIDAVLTPGSGGGGLAPPGVVNGNGEIGIPLGGTSLTRDDIVGGTAASASRSAAAVGAYDDGVIFAEKRGEQFLRLVPFTLAFQDRVRIFYGRIAHDKQTWREGRSGEVLEFAHGRGVEVTIRRGHELEDGYASMNALGHRLKGRVRVVWVDGQGMTEDGVDGGGLFKEFLVSLSKEAFSPLLGLYAETSEQSVYPSSQHLLASHQDNDMDSGSDADVGLHLHHHQFIGRIVGKAIYDNVQIEPRFANFYLRTVLGLYNGPDDLQSYDKELYRHVMWLKHYKGDVADLALDFSVEVEAFGATTKYDLIPNGRNIPVTNESRLRYIYALSDFKLNRQFRKQAHAFVRGVHDVVNVFWLRMFAADELQILISGLATPLDVTDLRRNTNYAGGYSADHECIRWFWECIEGFSPHERSLFLRFATSCSRAPLLGFKSLEPKFCIQRVGGAMAAQDSNSGSAVDDNGHGTGAAATLVSRAALPTSATCMNLLRLPRFPSKEVLREKLLYAITSGAGFALS